MSDHVKLTAEFPGSGGYRSIGLTRFQVEGDARAATEVTRAVFARHGLGEPEQVTVHVRAWNVGPGGFDVHAVGCERAKGRKVTEAEAMRFARDLLGRLGVTVENDE